MTATTTIEVTANGKSFTLAAESRLQDFLRELQFEPGGVVVEKNREALTPSETRDAVLKDGDRLEIVQITAGG